MRGIGTYLRRASRAALIVAVPAIVLSACTTARIRQTDLYRQYYDEPIRPPGPAAPSTCERKGDTHVFSLHGDEYAMDQEYGRKARDLGVDSFCAEVFANATRLLRGFADGSGLDIRDVHAMHAIPDFSETSCSAMRATGSATADGGTLQVRVLDHLLGLGIQREPAVVFMHFDVGHAVANIGWLGLLGVVSGMNDPGLAVSEMGTGIIRSHPRTASYAYIVGSARNGALAFTTDPYGVQVSRPGQADAPVPQFPDALHAGHYSDRMTSLLAEAYGRVSVEWLVRDYLPAIAMNSNLPCVIYDLEKGRFLVANAPDAERRAADQPCAEFLFPPAPHR